MDKIVSPANRAQPAAERKRIPMSVPVRKLEAPDIPGYHLHWFAGTPARIQRALDAGYEFVDQREMKLNPIGLGQDSTHSGNMNLGSRVSIVAGQDEQGQPEELVLMKIKEEWYIEDQKLVEERNDSVAQALAGGLYGAERDGQGDTQHRYVDKARTKLPDMFTKKRPRVVTT